MFFFCTRNSQFTSVENPQLKIINGFWLHTLLDKVFKSGHLCDSDMQLYEWKIILNYVYIESLIENLVLTYWQYYQGINWMFKGSFSSWQLSKLHIISAEICLSSWIVDSSTNWRSLTHSKIDSLLRWEIKCSWLPE